VLVRAREVEPSHPLLLVRARELQPSHPLLLVRARELQPSHPVPQLCKEHIFNVEDTQGKIADNSAKNI